MSKQGYRYNMKKINRHYSVVVLTAKSDWLQVTLEERDAED